VGQFLSKKTYAIYPNQKYVGDITYIPTNEGWIYLATVIDLYSRKIVGHSISDNLKTSLVNKALIMAIKRRNPPGGVIWHTDRGSQYVLYKHRYLCKNTVLSKVCQEKETAGTMQ